MTYKPTDEQLTQLQAQFGEGNLLTLEVDEALPDDHPLLGSVLVFKRPQRNDLDRLAQGAMKSAYKAMRQTCIDLVVFPSSQQLNEMFEQLPGLSISIGGALQRQVGTNYDFLVKKF